MYKQKDKFMIIQHECTNLFPHSLHIYTKCGPNAPCGFKRAHAYGKLCGNFIQNLVL